MTELQEQYRLLEVPADASLATLKQAYKDLVTVWHPDRFSGHPRLQKKAEEKLKCINLAYQQISAQHRTDGGQTTENCDRRSPPRTHDAQRHSQSRQTKNYNHHRPGTHQKQAKQHGYQSSGEISLEQARFILSHFEFRILPFTTHGHHYFKSGPFRLDIHSHQPWIRMENLCDSINGFHPILLAIPCKASVIFSGSEAEELIRLLKQTHSTG